MQSSKKSILRVVAIFDGRLGHEKQTLGIIQALQKQIPVELTEIKVKRGSVAMSILDTMRLFLPGKGNAHPALSRADLLIGTGTQTHLHLLLYKKGSTTPVCTCMTPAHHLRKFFNLCFIPKHDGVPLQPHIVHTIGAPNNCTNKQEHNDKKGLILLGGIDPKSHSWQSDEVVSMVRKVTEVDVGKKWTISSSPRTPQITVDKVKALSCEHDHITFFDYRDTEQGWIEKQYDNNAVAWVTSDSISMVYEALTAGCKVGIFPMRWVNAKSKFKINEDILLDKKLVRSFSSWEQNNGTWGKPAELNEAQRCAEEILLRWWPKNLL